MTEMGGEKREQQRIEEVYRRKKERQRMREISESRKGKAIMLTIAIN